MYGMISQIRRAAASIPANVAEGYGREYRAEYIQFLRIAQGSLKELETHLLLSARVELTTTQAVNPILNQCQSVGRLLRALIRSLQNKQNKE
jgi:four helix bundle protein